MAYSIWPDRNPESLPLYAINHTLFYFAASIAQRRPMVES